jgi:hypothetical protein
MVFKYVFYRTTENVCNLERRFQRGRIRIGDVAAALYLSTIAEPDQTDLKVRPASHQPG